MLYFRNVSQCGPLQPSLGQWPLIELALICRPVFVCNQHSADCLQIDRRVRDLAILVGVGADAGIRDCHRLVCGQLLSLSLSFFLSLPLVSNHQIKLKRPSLA